MLLDEVTLRINLSRDLIDVLIVPDGHEYHLFLSTTNEGRGKQALVERPENLGSIILVNKGWIYQGSQISKEVQKQIAHYIINYKDNKNPIYVKELAAYRQLIAV